MPTYMTGSKLRRRFTNRNETIRNSEEPYSFSAIIKNGLPNYNQMFFRTFGSDRVKKRQKARYWKPIKYRQFIYSPQLPKQVHCSWHLYGCPSLPV